MSEPPLDAAVREWAAVLAPEQVCNDVDRLREYEANVTAIQRKIPCVVYPMSTADVVEVVKVANRYRVPLYPISRGMNWGIGSRVPPVSGCAVVDLQRMDRIHEVSTVGQYAIVEPGVTQRQLADHLREQDLPLLLNVTGSGSGGSVIGNALERGIGYFSTRADALSGLEIVLGTGEVLQTGFGHYSDCTTTHVYRYGHGPGLDALFFQSNFGIVTRAGVDLMPRQDIYRAAILRIVNERDFAGFVDAVASLRNRDIVPGVIHIGNWHRTECVVGPLARRHLQAQGIPNPDVAQIESFMKQEGYGAWSAMIGLSGSGLQVKTLQKEIRRAMPAFVDTIFVDDKRLGLLERLCRWFPFVPSLSRKRALLPAIKELHGLSVGRPTNETVKSVYWSAGQEIPESEEMNPDLGNSGMIYVLPMLPMEGRVAREVVGETTRIFMAHDFTPYITINLIDRKIMEAVINLSFDRSDAVRTQDAIEAVRELTSVLRHRGWYPYRLRPDEMDDFITENDPFWQTARKLKAVFDPHHIIAPGRYNLV